MVLQQPDGLFGYVASVGFDMDILSQVRLERHELFYGDRLFSEPTLTTELESFNTQTLAPEKLALITRAGFGVNYRVSMGVPIFLEGELLAVFSLDNATDPHAFGPATRRLADVFAKHIGAALQKARFKDQLERAVRAQTLLAGVERLLLETPELKHFFPQLVEALMGTEGLALDQLVVYKYEEKTVRPHVYNGNRQRERQLEAEIRASRLDEVIAEQGSKLGSQFINARKPIYVADSWQEPYWIRLASNLSRTVLFCPVFRHGELWGVLEYASDTPHAFDAATRELLVSIAQGTELALARESDRNRLELSRMNAVVSSGETMRALGTRQEVFEEAVAAVGRRIQANFGALFWYHADGDCLVLEAGRRSDGDGSGVPLGLCLARGQGLGWQVMEEGATLHIGDEARLKELYRHTERVHARDYIGTPLRDSQGHALGILVAFSYNEGGAFGASDVAFLEAVAQATSGALLRLDLLGEAETKASAYQALYRTAERQHQELVLLDRVRTALARELDLEQVALTLVTVLFETLGHTSVGLYWLEGEAFRLREQAGLRGLDEPSQGAVLERALQEGRPVLQEHYTGSDGTAEGHLWEIAVPLYGHEKVLGVLSVKS